MAKSKINGKIEFFRFIFSIIIVLYHINNRVENPLPHHLSFFANGLIGVEFFFLVAGYLMAHSAYKNSSDSLGGDTARFMYKKAVKIFPIHWIILFCAVVGYIIDFIAKSKGGKFDLLVNVIGFFPSVFLIQKSGIESLHTIPLEWYLSAMLIAMAVIYPLLLKYKSTFSMCVCPVLSVLLIGYMSHTDNMLDGIYNFSFGDTVPKALVRAVAELCMGVFIYELLRRFKNKDISLTSKSRAFLTVLEVMCYVSVIIFTFIQKQSRFEPYAFYVLAVAVALSFSEATYFNGLFNNKFVYYLGKISLPIYLCQVLPLKLLEFDLLHMSFIFKVIIVVGLTLVLAVILNPINSFISNRIDKKIGVSFR